MKIYGIDVSHHQGAIDWAKTASELRRVNGGTSPGFAILRVGYSARHGKGGLYMDGQFLNNLAACEKYGVPVGVYFYCYDTSPAAARITAQQVVKMLSGHKFAYPIYYDVEYEKYNLNCGKAQNTAIIKAALETMEAGGYYAAVYCSRDFFINYTDLSGLANFDKWEAAYTKTDTARCRMACGSIPARTRWELQASAIAWTATSATATIPPLWKRTD
jgi:GH25 family lysozyme M1 (1,4-beta-N-acetylmuramidase)